MDSASPIKINTKYFAAIREIIGKKEDFFILSGNINAKNLLDAMCSRYGKPFSEFVMDPSGLLKENLIILVNGKSIDKPDLSLITLTDGDLVVILPPIGGG